MVNDLYPKRGLFFTKNDVVRTLFQFSISVILGVIYGVMLINETIGGYINKLLPSTDGPDLHLYLPVVITVFIYSCFIQKQQRIFLEKISFSFLHIFVALISCFSSVVVLLVI